MSKAQKRRLTLLAAVLGVSIWVALLVGCCVWVVTASSQKALAVALFTLLVTLLSTAVILWGSLVLEWLASGDED